MVCPAPFSLFGSRPSAMISLCLTLAVLTARVRTVLCQSAQHLAPPDEPTSCDRENACESAGRGPSCAARHEGLNDLVAEQRLSGFADNVMSWKGFIQKRNRRSRSRHKKVKYFIQQKYPRIKYELRSNVVKRNRGYSSGDKMSVWGVASSVCR